MHVDMAAADEVLTELEPERTQTAFEICHCALEIAETIDLPNAVATIMRMVGA